ncbi:outer membrane protein [Bradyrhizobium sp. 930_D9_N1_4]|uniref:outer membrane protein n=1 Tax=Bradyrhizobium sp. 930_D9_N1_4 TaxID=3240374 RepID=UPI003F892E1A
MITGAAHAEDVPSNAELFRMLKAQQQTISELRAELKQAKQERRTATPTEARAAASPAGRDAARETVAAAPPAQAYAMYNKGPAVVPARNGGAYVGVFGGGGSRGGTDVSQLGTVFFIEAAGGPLAVDASGRTSSGGVGFGGAHLGYEWSYGAYVRPALEIEGFYLAGNQPRATLVNPTDRLAEHSFDTTFPMRTTVLLANMVVGFNTPYQGITPYVGGGIGAANVSINGATSTQTDPVEPGVNHFNARPDSSAWTFAAQAKAGARFALGNSGAYLFGEYRYLYIGDVNQVFGSTVSPGHAATSPWTASFGGTSHHLAAGGIGFGF